MFSMSEESPSEPSDSPTDVHRRTDLGKAEPATEAEASGESRQRGRHLERTCLIVLTLIAIFFTLYFARSIMLPTTMAVVISLVLKPITRRLGHWGLPAPLAALLVLGALSFLLWLGLSALWEPANRWIEQAPRSLQRVRQSFGSVRSPLDSLREFRSEMEKMASGEAEPNEGEEASGDQPSEAAEQTEDDAEQEKSDPRPVPVQVQQPPLSDTVVSNTGSYAAAFIICLSFIFFLLASGDRFLEKAVQVRRTWREKRDVVVFAKELERKMSTYLGSITLINICLGVVIGTGLWLIGMPSPLLWGVLAAALNYIPFAGLFVGTAIVSVVALGELPSISTAMLAPAIYLGANALEANILTPAVLGHSISLNPVVILFAVFVGGWLWGVGGIFLSVPLLLILKMACDTNDSLRPVAVFLER